MSRINNPATWHNTADGLNSQHQCSGNLESQMKICKQKHLLGKFFLHHSTFFHFKKAKHHAAGYKILHLMQPDASLQCSQDDTAFCSELIE
jgi:hypothetical protein